MLHEVRAPTSSLPNLDGLAHLVEEDQEGDEALHGPDPALVQALTQALLADEHVHGHVLVCLLQLLPEVGLIGRLDVATPQRGRNGFTRAIDLARK